MNSSSTTRPSAVRDERPVRPRAKLSAPGWLGRSIAKPIGRLLGNLQCGTLSLDLPDGTRIEGEGAQPGPRGVLTLHRWRPLLRMALRGDIGLAESYRDGDWSTPDLSALLECGIRNEAAIRGLCDASWPAQLMGRLSHLARSNSRRGSRHNISFHYDMGNAFYAQWLDPDMLYSSALYRTGRESLEQAQAAKLVRIIELLELVPRDASPDTSVLEIGCGWGALALALAGDHQANVTGLTLSKEQLAHARSRVDAKGLTSRVDLRLQDYRDVAGRYERIVSIEMMEAVGERYWPVYFDTLRQRLAPGGKAVIQVITIADEHFDHYRRSADFIQRFIFPGGMLPSVGAMHAQADRAGLVMEQAETFGSSYASTLVEWRQRFLAAWPAIEKLGFDAAFKRLWEYYLCYCEAGFRSGRVDVGLFTLKFKEPSPASPV